MKPLEKIAQDFEGCPQDVAGRDAALRAYLMPQAEELRDENARLREAVARAAVGAAPEAEPDDSHTWVTTHGPEVESDTICGACGVDIDDDEAIAACPEEASE